jgi:hypothetical protein
MCAYPRWHDVHICAYTHGYDSYHVCIRVGIIAICVHIRVGMIVLMTTYESENDSPDICSLCAWA